MCYRWEQFQKKGGIDIDTPEQELRNSNNHLLCKTNIRSGDIETEGPHKSIYRFNIPIGGSFTVTRGSITYTIKRESIGFSVADTHKA